MQNIDASALAAAKAKLDAAEAQREEVLLRHIANGVDIRSRNVEIGSEVVIAPGAVILAGTILRGKTTIGAGCVIGPNTLIEDSTVDEGTTVNASQVYSSHLGPHNNIGPFTHVRINTVTGYGVHLGAYVETKNSNFARGNTVSHLTYIGDSDVGKYCNFGCGTVTCNYDGKDKFRTQIGDYCFIGCNTNLVAPVKVGDGAYTAAGSTITKDVPAQALGIAQGAFEHALSYSKERVQFGKPIAAQQSIAFKLADMATKLRCARFLIYSAAELKEQHAPYGMESAMAKMYASDIALEVTNDALQIHGGSGYLKGMEVERAYRDAKITTLYEGTNEIQRVVIASHLLGRLGKSSGGESRSAAKKPAPITGIRKKTIFREGDAAQQVADLVAALKKDGHDFSVGIPMDTPIPQAERVVSAGKGIGEKKNMKLVESLAKAAGAAIGSSRPVAETLKYLPLNRYVGMSGQKFTGNLYIACGISGASQHLKGIKDASTIVAINKNGNAPIFKNCDYGIVGDVEEILPLLTAALDSGEKLPAPPMVKMKRPTPPKPAPIGDRYVCSGCGYEYVPELGDEDGEIAPGTLFEQLPAEWVCPECAETKDQFVKA